MGFENMPEIPEEETEKLRESFEHYLFFVNEKRGVRRWRCTGCGKRYMTGEMKRLISPEERELTEARIGERRICAECGRRCTVKSELRTNAAKLVQNKYVVFMLPVSRDEVWLRCVEAGMHADERGGFSMSESMRVRLAPGDARQWEYNWYHTNNWCERDRPAEPFTYNYALYCEKHSYTICACGGGIDKTFLKYSAAERFATRCADDVPWVKYLMHYAKRPALEMVVKLGMMSIAAALVYDNLANTRVIDWEARKPWELVRLPKNVFNVWFNKGKNLNALKLFRRMKGKSERDMEDAIELLGYVRYNEAVTAAAAIRESGGSVRRLLKYTARISEEFRGMCGCGPGIAQGETFNLWLDYADMVKRMKLTGKANLFPKDLKGAHDALARTCEIKDMKEHAAAVRKAAAAEAAGRKKEFPRVEKIYKRIRKKYEFESGGFKIAVPEKIEDILFEGMMLNTCLSRTGRYFERIQDGESYLFFLRKTDEPDMPWYTIEAEPGGAVRQKRTMNDCQNSDLAEAESFLREWQENVKKHMTAADKRNAARSREARLREFALLREQSIRVNYGAHAGMLLADILERDLME